MMTIKELKNLLLHFEDSYYDDFKVTLWDYNHQQELEWGASHSFSKPKKEISFAVTVPTTDNITIFERLKEFCKNQQENGICKKDK